MANQCSLSWALRPDPECGTRIIAVWTIEAGSGAQPVEALEIDLLGRAQRFRDQVRSEWIVIDDDAPETRLVRSDDTAPDQTGIDALLAAVRQPGSRAGVA